MSERVIKYADLSVIENNLHNLNRSLDYVAGQVNTVEHQISVTQNELDKLIQEFRQFVQRDLLEKNIQLSETRLVKIRQELETEYGHYAETRRAVIGILQAVDKNIVKKETINNTSEEQMLLAPRYWLAPCLVALSAWVNDKKDLANRALSEALKRNEQKTTLFFALISRRIGRYQTSTEWLNRYLGLQNPYELERSIVILIDGFANGIFGPEARRKSGEAINEWVGELASNPTFIEEQMEQWTIAIESKIPNSSYSEFSFLAQYSPQWPELQSSLQHTEVHDKMETLFKGILETPVMAEKSIAIAVDAILDRLVSEFDEEELPLRKKERMESLVLEYDGDRNYAQRMFENEKTLDEKISFTQLLTNFVMHPDVSKSSIATQKLGLALSKQWIIDAHNDFTTKYRSKKLTNIDIQIDDWKGNTRDGSNEEELAKSLHSHLLDKQENDIEMVKKGFNKIGLGIGMAAGVVLAVIFTTPFWLVLTAVFAYLYFSKDKKTKTQIQNVISHYEQLFKQQKDILRGTLAEYVEWEVTFQRETEKAAKIEEILKPVTVDQYSFSSYDSTRSIIAR